MRVLVLNAGSSNLKWTLFDGDTRAPLAEGRVEWTAPVARRGEEIRATLRGLPPFDVVGHRVVLGGRRFLRPTVIDARARADLERIAVLDPLHMAPALAGIDAVAAEFPTVPQVGAFDTSFHASMPEAAAGYALPFEWSERWALRRYGFHGHSVEYALGRTRALLGRTPARLIVCHLGSGCSITAVADGRSIDTTMGMTPLDGVMMGTRSGAVDPGLLLHLLRRCGVTVDELDDVLANRSGLLGVSGVSGDLRQVRAAAADPRARLAYDQFVWTLRRAVGAMAGVLGGVDALVFTGGIGENDAGVRRDVCAALAFAGLRLADDAAASDDRILSAADSRVAVLLVHAREDLVILDAVLTLAPGTHR